MVEVLDHYHGPARRKLWLLALAEHANDGTRTGWCKRVRLAHRAGVSVSYASHIAAALIAEGVIKRDGGGYHGSPVRYVIAPLAERVRPGSNLKGAPREQPSAGPTVHPESNLKGATAGRKVAVQRATHPSYPSDKPSVPPAGAAAPPPTAQTILAEFIDWDRANGGQLTTRTTGQLARHIADLLAEGISEQPIKRGLADWRKRDQYPSTLHSFVDAAMNGHPTTSRREGERQAKWARQLERARHSDAAERGELT